jgi:DNA topoisomerase-1
LVERERDIQNFNASASYSVVAEFTNEGKSFKAKLPKISIQKKKLKILNKNIGSTYTVSDLETKPTKKSPMDLLPLLLYSKKQRGNYTYQESLCN